MTLYVLFEHASGYALLKSAVSVDDSLDYLTRVKSFNSFTNIVELISYQPFKTGRDALENINCLTEGILHSQLQEFLENNVPKSKKKHPVVLGVCETKLGAAISEGLGISCAAHGIIPDLIRGIRLHFFKLVPDLSDIHALHKAQLGLGHSYSRAKVKFNVNRIDNMIIQSISLLDQLDKDINTFTMRVREWYSHHFPELIKIVPENPLFVQCVKVVKDRKNMPEDVADQLESILNDPIKAVKIVEAANNSMGMDISSLDLENVYLFAERIMSLTQRRKDMMDYLKKKMTSVAPNLAALIGEVVGARLIAHAGSLINLAKCPASTVQILGAEKALFRALKTRGNTPKYGLIYHSRFIGKAGKPNKGRISRYLANKCSVASRIDCFRDIPTDVFGIKLREQVEARLKYYETGEIPEKNLDVMDKAMEEAEVVEAEILKKIKKAKKKAKKEKSMNESSFLSSSGLDSCLVFADSMSTSAEQQEKGPQEDQQDDTDFVPKKKKKKSKRVSEEMMDNNTSMEQSQEIDADVEMSSKKRKKFDSTYTDTSWSVENGLENGESDLSSKKKKKKKKRQSLEAEA